MPKFVGCNIPGSTRIQANAPSLRGVRVKLTYKQALLLPAEHIQRSLDTSDRGGVNQFAKRWYRWFAAPDHILLSSDATPNMRERAHFWS